MRLFFHLTNGRNFLRDASGVEVEDLAAACRGASRAIEELRHEEDFDRYDWIGWQLQITDPSGVILLVAGLPFH